MLESLLKVEATVSREQATVDASAESSLDVLLPPRSSPASSLQPLFFRCARGRVARIAVSSRHRVERTSGGSSIFLGVLRVAPSVHPASFGPPVPGVVHGHPESPLLELDSTRQARNESLHRGLSRSSGQSHPSSTWTGRTWTGGGGKGAGCQESWFDPCRC